MIMSHSLQWNLEKILFRVIVFDGDAVVPEVWSDPDRVARQLQKYFKLYPWLGLDFDHFPPVCAAPCQRAAPYRRRGAIFFYFCSSLVYRLLIAC